VFWKRFRSDTPDHAADQLAELFTRHEVDTVLFTDSLLNGHQKRLRSFAETVLSRGMRFSWGGFMRADMDPDTAALLARAGLDRAFIGVESMSDETLELMNKRRSEADNVRAIRAFLEAGVRVKVGLIPGFPGDTRERFEHTVAAVMALSRAYPDQLRVNLEPFIVSPGQPLARDLAAVGLTAKPWAEDYLDLSPELRFATGSIACTVEGANQGAERMGQIAWLRAQIEDADPGAWFSHSHRETVTFAPSLIWIDGGNVLVTRKSKNGLIYGVIVTPEEQRTTGIMAELSADRREYPTLDAIAARHFIPPRPGSPHVVCFESRRTLEPDRRAAISPFAIARQVSATTVIVAHLLQQTAIAMPVAVLPILAELARTPASGEEIAALIAERRITIAPAEWAEAAGELYRAGYLVTLPRQPREGQDRADYPAPPPPAG
jgi:hypothetical protein